MSPSGEISGLVWQKTLLEKKFEKRKKKKSKAKESN